MAWELLPVDYTDAVWNGLKKYNLINNTDSTVSLQDVTQYSHREKSFFGAKDANRMNEALNTIMSMVEGGADLYSAFQNYFSSQKQLFENKANESQSGFNTYVDNLKQQGDKVVEKLKTDYKTEMDQFENTQESVFNTWFNFIKNQLGSDAAGNLQNQISELKSKTNSVKSINLTVANWKGTSAPYTQQVNVPRITENDSPVGSAKIEKGAAATVKKAAECIDGFETGAGTITFYCNRKKPTANVTVILKGVE